MFNPLFNSLPQTSGSQNILADLRGPETQNSVPTQFARELERSVRNPEPLSPAPERTRTASPEPVREKPLERNRSKAQDGSERYSDGSGARTQEASTSSAAGQPSKTGNASSDSTDSAEGVAEDAKKTESASSESTQSSETQEQASALVATNPAKLAELAAAIAAVVARANGEHPAPEHALQGADLADLEGAEAGLNSAGRRFAEIVQSAALASEGKDPAQTSGLAQSVKAESAKPGETADLLNSARQADSKVAVVATLATQTESTGSGSSSGSAQPSPSLAAMAPAPTGAGARTETQAVQQLPVYTPAGQKAWSEDVGNRLIWMANRGESRAELVLTPPSLGKLGVSIQINGDQTTAQFIAATPAARDALEQAMPRLREILQQAGINLGQADVSTSEQHQAQQGHEHNGRGRHHQGGQLNLEHGISLPPSVAATWVQSGDGMIDIFA